MLAMIVNPSNDVIRHDDGSVTVVFVNVVYPELLPMGYVRPPAPPSPARPAVDLPVPDRDTEHGRAFLAWNDAPSAQSAYVPDEGDADDLDMARFSPPALPDLHDDAM